MASQRIATVFGGSGFIGRYVVQRLAALGCTVRVCGRYATDGAALRTQGTVGQIVPMRAPITDDAAVARAVAGADWVVNLVGILFEGRRGDFARIHAEGAGRVARLAAAAGVSRLVQVSAIGADAQSPSDYARTKAEGEAAVRAAFPGAVVLRPSVVFGAEDGFFNRFAGLASMLPFMPVISGGTRFQPVFVGDVADAIVASLTREDTVGRTYELGGPRVMSMRDVLSYVLETTGRRRIMLDAPIGLVRFKARFLELLPTPPITRDQLKLLERDNVVSEDAAGLAELGVEPSAVEAIVPAYLARYRSGGARRRPGTA